MAYIVRYALASSGTEPIRDAHKRVNFQGQNFVAKKKSR